MKKSSLWVASRLPGAYITAMTRGRPSSGAAAADVALGPHGGRIAIAGFLFQILRAVRLGLEVTAEIAVGDRAATMTLTIEPDTSGDIQITRDGRKATEQVKMRSHGRRWTSGEVARVVLPDLLCGVEPGSPQDFRFVTDNPAGLDQLRTFLAQRHADPNAQPEMLRWGNQRVDQAAFGAMLAEAAGVGGDDPRFGFLLDRLSLKIVDAEEAIRGIDRLLAPLVDPATSVSDTRHALIAKLFEAAAEGRAMTDRVLLGMVGPDALLRLRHAQALPSILQRKLAADVAALGYESDQQARETPLFATAQVTILTGESGQGKTWSLCQAAWAETEAGRLAVVFRAPAMFAEVVQAINERVWLPAYGTAAPLQTIARRLRPDLARADGTWLTVYLDDLQERGLARSIADFDWFEIGIRLVVSAQPRITALLQRVRPAVELVPVANFTSAELRRYLRHHDRDAALEMMPDDVFELLAKPIHAQMFVTLPRRDAWVAPTEYELFKGYWQFATGETRDQYDHPHDADRLAALAGELLGPNPRYPWRPSELRRIALDDGALSRLELVGLIARPQTDRIVFGSDRMLNWAISEYIAKRVVDECWSFSDVDRVLHQIEEIVVQDGIPLGQRLGYVLLDTLWLLLQETDAKFVADLILADVQRRPHEWRGESMWSDSIGSLGAAAIPAIEFLAFHRYDEERDWDIPRNLQSALGTIARNDPDAVRMSIGRLLDNGKVQPTMIALRTARHLAVPEQLDRLWAIHLDRCRALADCLAAPGDRENFAELSGRVDVSRAAIRPSLAAAPAWFERRLAESVDAFELNELVWRLTESDGVDFARARSWWSTMRDRFFAVLSGSDKALIHAIEYFGDVDRGDWLTNVPRTREDWLGARVLKARARLNPKTAFEQIADREEDYGWSSADWWIEDLARADAVALSAAIRANADKGDNPLTDIILFYGNHAELMDEPTLEFVLDEFASQLRTFNDRNTADGETGRLGHPLRFLSTLSEPWQFDSLRNRAGTALEAQLLRFGAERRGRTTRLYDSEGGQCARILAMIAGEGFDALTVAELAREDQYGRDDGYRSAHWTEGEDVRAALAASAEEPDPDGYRQVLRMQALAIHRCDVALENMVRAEAPIYVNAAKMRSDPDRGTEQLRARVEQLVATEDAGDLRAAIDLAGFLRDAAEAASLLPPFIDPTTPEATRRSMIGTLKALHFYDRSMLTFAETLMATGSNDETQFVAAFLAQHGDAAARVAVVAWLQDLDLGTWSTARHAYLPPLLEHADSRKAVVAFLLRSREQGHLIYEPTYLRALAEAGDQRSHDELVRAAYRGPQGFHASPVAAIDYLRTVDPQEAFFAAVRLLARHGTPAAIDLLLHIDRERAIPELIRRYRTSPPSLRWDIARRLRLYCPPSDLAVSLTDLAMAGDPDTRLVAIEIGGWMAPTMGLDWLSEAADHGDERARKAAREALRNRAREAAAMGHLRAIATSPKPLKWARLMTIVESVDPSFLWSRDDPASLGPVLRNLPYEFWVETRDAKNKRSKKLDDDAKKADRDRN